MTVSPLPSRAAPRGRRAETSDSLDTQDEGICVRQAANPDSDPQTLRTLATDPRVTVRAAVALNPSAPEGVDATLARDADSRVRQLLGQKLARLLPGLSEHDQQHLRQQVLATLERLVEDEVERVRAAIAEIVKDMPDAPRDLILRLARDTAIPVSEPVLRLSPVLTPADLLALLSSPPGPSTAQSIAGRPFLAAEVADAIAEGGDLEAIRILLENGTAHLQEATLDALASRAGRQESWHLPLVKRPKLSGRAARTLSTFVTTRLLATLADRGDLPAEVTETLRRRLADQAPAPSPAPPRAVSPEAANEQALHLARGLASAGCLDEAAIQNAAQNGDARLCGAMLAIAADVPIAVVDRAANLRSAKGIVSLVWMADMSMDLAIALQAVIAQVAPNAVLRGLDGNAFPLTVDEMRWQVDLLRQMGR